MNKIDWIRLSWLMGFALLWLGVIVASVYRTYEALVAGLLIVTLTALLMPDIGRLYVPK